jgi:hypothetical protein
MESIKHVFVTSDLGCEVGLTALARFLLPKDRVCAINIKMAVIGNPDALIEELKTVRGILASVTLCGDFWPEECLERVQDRWPGLDIHNYRFDGTGIRPGLVRVALSDTPTAFIIRRVREIIGESPMLQFAAAQHARALDLLDARCQGVRVSETQPFFAGLCNVAYPNAKGPLDLEDRLFRLFSGEFTLDEVLKIGWTIVQSQIEIARERALKNARSGALKNGMPYVITDGPEFVNLTHEELHSTYPDAKVTIVASLKFADNQADVVAHSMRAWAPDVDVKLIIGAHGGGSATAAGARRELDIHLDY